MVSAAKISSSFWLMLLLPIGSLGFPPQNFPMPFSKSSALQSSPLQPSNSEKILKKKERKPSRFKGAILPFVISGLLALTAPVWAAEGDVAVEAPVPTTISIEACRKDPAGGITNCVSTKNVKQLDLYSPPWTFETSPGDAFARLKGVVASDPNLELVQQQDDLYYLEVKAIRNGIFNDNLQFLINAKDKVVFFRAEQGGEPSVSDFGAIRKELDSIRRQSQIFGVMGEGISADSMPSQNGPGGQLKAFFGLQSGQGFEDVFDED